MGRSRKLSPEAVQHAAVDRRNGMSWEALSQKYKCAVNTVRFALSEYSDEFVPVTPQMRLELETKLDAALSEIEKLKRVLKEQFNLQV